MPSGGWSDLAEKHEEEENDVKKMRSRKEEDLLYSVLLRGGGRCLDSSGDRQHILPPFGKLSRQSGSYLDCFGSKIDTVKVIFSTKAKSFEGDKGLGLFSMKRNQLQMPS